jgi:hypothetical protein
MPTVLPERLADGGRHHELTVALTDFLAWKTQTIISLPAASRQQP